MADGGLGCLAERLMGWLAGWLVGWQAGAGQNAARLDLTKKRWICDNFMKETVTFLEGCLGESLGGVRPGWLASRPAGRRLAGRLSGWKFKENRPTHGRP